MKSTSRVQLPTSGGQGELAVTVVMWLVASLVAMILIGIVGDLVWHGIGGLRWSFLADSPARAGRSGGIAPILVSTLLILAIAMAVALPLGLAAAIGLSDFSRRGGAFASIVGRTLDVLAAVPSIVFGLFGNAVFCGWMGLGYSLLAGGLTLACMVLPILVRTIEASLRSVPDDYRVAAASLGISRTRATWSVLLPRASAGIVVGWVLGIGRVLAETAALLFTSGYVDRMPRGITDSGRSLSVHIYDLSMNIPGGTANAYTASLVLVGMLLLINGMTRVTVHVCLRGSGASE